MLRRRNARQIETGGPESNQTGIRIAAELGKDQMNSTPETGDISLPADGGTAVLSDVVRRLDAGGIQLAELSLAQPTLDDVFLAITGHAAENAADTKKTK